MRNLSVAYDAEPMPESRTDIGARIVQFGGRPAEGASSTAGLRYL